MSDTRFYPFVMDNDAGQETIAGVGSDQAKYGVGVSSDFIVSGNVGIGTTTPTSPLTIFKEDPQYVGVSTVLTLRTFRTDMSPSFPAGGSIKFENYDGNYDHEAFIEVIAPESHSGSEAAREKTADFNFKQTNNGTLNTRLTIQGETGLIKGTLHTLIGEHSAATNAGELFSFGNGATDNQGPAMPFAGEVVVVTISKSGGSDAGTFQPSKNGVTQGSASDQITTTTGSGTVTKNNADYSSLMDFVAGDRINYVTIDGTDTTTCLTMFVRFNP